MVAALARSPQVRFHVVKNRILTLLRNETRRDFLVHLPFILCRDLATFALLLATSPRVLTRLWSARAVFRQAWRTRRLDSTGRVPHVEGGGPGGREASGDRPRPAAERPVDPGQA